MKLALSLLPDSSIGRVIENARHKFAMLPNVSPHHHTLILHNMTITDRSCFVASLVFTFFLAACSDRQAPRLSISADSAESTSNPAPKSDTSLQSSRLKLRTAADEPAATAPVPPSEIDPAATSPKGDPRQWWEAVYAYGTKIGWCHTQITDRQDGGRKLAQIDYQSHITVDRQGQQTAIDIVTGSTENPDGELQQFHTEMTSGASRTQTNGRVEEGQLKLETITQGKTTEESFAWPPGTLGFSATEQSLAKAPLLPGQRRSLRALMPATNEVVNIELVADKYEPTSLVDHTEDLLRIDSSIVLPMHGSNDRPSILHSQLWTNRVGQVLKTSIGALHQETYRTTKDIALAESGTRRLDLVIDNTVPVAQALADPHATKRIKYRVQLAGDDPAKIFYSGGSQQVTPLDPHTAEITVRRIELESAPAAGAEVPGSSKLPTADDRAPNNLIQSDDTQVVTLANSVAPNETDPRQLAIELEKFVKQAVTMKNFSQAFDTAAEVARQREGDCTEHAVLLAGLARARGIPARVAIGLVYQASTQSFAYHMWNELWLTDRWVPMDATLGRGGIGAAHLKLADSNLAGAQAYSCFLPVAQVIGQLKIEILEVE